jgi:hypothetical protein
LRKQLRRTAPSGEQCSVWNPYVAVQDHQNGMSSSWRGTRLKTTQIVTRRREDNHPRQSGATEERSAHFESVGQILLGVPPEVFL